MDLARRLPRFEARIDALIKIISFHDNGKTLPIQDVYTVERALIQLQIEWELFLRNLILDSATGLFTTNSKPIISPIGFANREIAAHYLISQYPKRKVEPDWYLPAEAVKAAKILNVSNFTNIPAQLGLSPWLIDDLRYVRNFIAHRSKRSALTLRTNGTASTTGIIDPISIAFSYSPSGIKSYVGWATFIKFVAKQLVK